ncbi:MAG: ELM1/GtrOC1 family putative glycosyltransferase [Hyphomicrobiaceae bacterium]
MKLFVLDPMHHVNHEPDNLRRILVVHCKHRGDLNNALGIASAISQRTGLPIHVNELALRSNILIRPLLFLTGAACWYDWSTRLVYRVFFRNSRKQQFPKHVAYVVSTLGAGEAPNVFLTRTNNAVGIHLGRPKRVPFRAIDIVVAHQGHEAGADEIALPISPSRVMLSHYLHIEQRKGILLAIGGNTEEVSFSDSFWRNLCIKATRFATDSHAKILITTSPRTGEALENQISKYLSDSGPSTKKIEFYSSGTARPLTTLLETTRVAIISCESVSMISEGIASGALVVAAFGGKLPQSQRISNFLIDQQKASRLCLWNVEAEETPNLKSLKPIKACWSDHLWDAIRELHSQKSPKRSDI